MKAWIKAFRLRTLPLALSSIFMGSFLAAFFGRFQWPVFVLACVTTLFLQVLSNLANDYGDAVSGMDNDSRVGPQRMVQSGRISAKAMKKMMGIFVLLSLCSGLLLIWFVFGGFGGWQEVLFVCLGMGAIGASIKYTVGKNPYGYRGMGDIFVFLFFGIVGVVGTFVLHTGLWCPTVIFPAASVGLLSTAVLNLNNLRDAESDKAYGKKTMVVLLGSDIAKKYHYMLMAIAFLFLIMFATFRFDHIWQWGFIILIPLYYRNLQAVKKNESPALLDPELRRTALTTLITVLVFGVSLFL